MALVALGYFAQRQQQFDKEDMETNTRHAHQDLRLVAYLLGAILVTLGIIADRLH